MARPKNTPEILAKRAIERFFSYITYEPNTGCWLWHGCCEKNGYAVININRKKTWAHRYSYVLHKGDIPQGLQLDHLCRVTCCVNPDHLEAVTPKINSLRSMSFAAINNRKTHCPCGHPYNKENTRTGKNGHRSCKICTRERQRKKRIFNFQTGITSSNKWKSHCINGHEFNEKNTKIKMRKDGCRERVCITCYREDYLKKKEIA